MFVVVFLAVQMAIPIVALGEPRPARFGWQMFSGDVPQPAVGLILRDGEREPVSLEELSPVWRGDLPYRDHLGPYLCQRPEVQAVVIEIRSGEEVVHPCD